MISTPTTSETITVREANTIPVCGRSSWSAFITEPRPLASPSPRKRPATEAASPITKPSSSTERRTCRREAPSVRNVANSRVLWATVIERVLKITNAPTNSAMAPKASRKYWMNFVKSLMSFELACACSAPVLTAAEAGRIGATSRFSCSGETPSFAASEIASYWPTLSRSFWAVGTSKTANVAPPSESTPPMLAVPVIVYQRAGP